MTKIEWTNRTWNPIVGCAKVSAGCKFCYAERMAKRLAAMGQKEYQDVITETGRWNGRVVCLPERLSMPLKWRKPQMVFVNSMSDLFHPDVRDEFIDSVWQIMGHTPQHIYQILTKRPTRMYNYMTQASEYSGLEPLNNVWLGTSVKNQDEADKRIPWLLETPAAVRFLSVDPMLGPVDIFSHPGETEPLTPYPNKLDWVICGCESGPGARPFNLDWARSLRDQCQAAGVPFFLKQARVDGKLVKMPELDGRVWAEYPEATK